MACLLNSGYQLSGCKGNNSGGVAYMYIAPFSSTTVFNMNASETITGMTGAPTFYTFDLTKQTSSFTDSPTASIENDVLYYAQEVRLIINRLNPTVRNQIKVLAQSRVFIIVKDNNGYFWLFGRENGLDLAEGTAGSGVATTDRSGYELVFQGNESNPAYNVASTAFTQGVYS